MKFSDYQKQAMLTAIYPDMGNNPYYPALGLGESGEVQNKIKKIMRDQGGVITTENRMAIKKELGDLLWYIAATCYEFKISLEDVAKENLDKLSSRQQRGKLQGDGDER